MTPEELALLIEFGEAEAVADRQLALPSAIANQWGVEVQRIGGAIVSVISAWDIPLFNCVIGLGLKEPASEAMVAEIAALYRRNKVRGMVQLSPAAQPAQLPAWLTAHGFHLADDWAKFYRPTSQAPTVATDLRIEEVGAEYADAVGTLVTGIFGMPPPLHILSHSVVGRSNWHCYLAFDGVTPVAVGALYVNGEVGSLQMGATLPSHRGRGAQGAIMARRIADAAAFGCRWITTETGNETPAHPNPSYHNMVRTGFQLAYVRPNYLLGMELSLCLRSTKLAVRIAVRGPVDSLPPCFSS